MFSPMFIGAYALSRLTGLVSSDVAMIHRENKAMKHNANAFPGGFPLWENAQPARKAEHGVRAWS